MGESWVDEAGQAEIPLAGGDVTEGVGDVIKRREAWLERNGAALTAALTAP
ncbi:MAG TPA: hypothetical protein VFV73_21675 [Streptosporangiaceae bacterium]|nr:hypothetical protein [Streptosporangiaceae bacterium]